LGVEKQEVPTMSVANDVVKSILLAAFDGESLYTIFVGEPALCWFRWSASDALLAALAGAGVSSKDAVLDFVSNALDSFAWPRCDSPVGPCVFTLVAEAREPPDGFSALYGNVDKRMPGKDVLVFCVRPADLQLGALSANGVREFCELFKSRFFYRQERDGRVPLAPTASPLSDVTTLVTHLSTALCAPRGTALATPPVSLFCFEWEASSPECLVFGDDIEANVCVVSLRLRKATYSTDLRLFVTTTTFSGLASMGWLHDNGAQLFFDTERTVFANRHAILAVYREERARYVRDPWSLVVDWLDLKRHPLVRDSHWRALAKARIWVGSVALGLVRDELFGQDVLQRATAKGDAAAQIMRLVAARRQVSILSDKFDNLIADAWHSRLFWLTSAFSSRAQAVVLTADEEKVGFDRVRMVYEAYHAQANYDCKWLIEQICDASTMPYALPALEFRANQLEFVTELSKAATVNEDGELLWSGHRLVEMYRRDSAATRPTRDVERRLLADAIEKRLFRHAPPSRLVSARNALGLLAGWPASGVD
jgi:hypothetical protein